MFALFQIFIDVMTEMFHFSFVTLHEQPTVTKFHLRSSGLSITAAAKTLGVTREYLSRVIHGHLKSKRMTRRYTELIAARNYNQTNKP